MKQIDEEIRKISREIDRAYFASDGPPRVSRILRDHPSDCAMCRLVKRTMLEGRQPTRAELLAAAGYHDAALLFD